MSDPYLLFDMIDLIAAMSPPERKSGRTALYFPKSEMSFRMSDAETESTAW